MFSYNKKMAVALLAVIFFVVLDRLFKVLAISGVEQSLAGQILKFNLKANYYISFSLPLFGVWLNILILLIILSLVTALIRSWRRGETRVALCLATIILGAASNLFDRLNYGYVVDYLDLKYFTVFNLADAMVVVGVASLLFVTNKKEAN